MQTCHRCGRELQLGSKIARTEGCPTCHSDLKCCRNCELHDRGAHNECREPQSEWVADKEKANFCEFFEFRDGSGTTRGRSPRGDAKSALDALFRE